MDILGLGFNWTKIKEKKHANWKLGQNCKFSIRELKLHEQNRELKS